MMLAKAGKWFQHFGCRDLLTVTAQRIVLIRRSMTKRAHSFLVHSRVAWGSLPR